MNDRTDEWCNRTHGHRGAVFVELGHDLLPHVGKHGGNHDKGAGGTEAQGPGESDLKGGLVEAKTRCALVYDEEH